MKKYKSRPVTIRAPEHHRASRAARRREKGPGFAAAYARRAGVEGTISKVVRTCGVRRSRYVNLTKTHPQHLLTAAAMNFVRGGRVVRRRTESHHPTLAVRPAHGETGSGLMNLPEVSKNATEPVSRLCTFPFRRYSEPDARSARLVSQRWFTAVLRSGDPSTRGHPQDCPFPRSRSGGEQDLAAGAPGSLAGEGLVQRVQGQGAIDEDLRPGGVDALDDLPEPVRVGGVQD